MTAPDRSFLDALASKAPVPGGGGASAFAGALAAALSSMVANLTIGKARYAEVEPEMRERLARCEELRARLLGLIDEDAAAFEPLAAAYGLPRDTAEERSERERVMERALCAACEPPRAIMAACDEVLGIAEFMAASGSRLAASDAAASARLAQAALEAASFNVYINAASLADRERAAELEREADNLCARARERADCIVGATLEAIRK